jgi:hypothetical protein
LTATKEADIVQTVGALMAIASTMDASIAGGQIPSEDFMVTAMAVQQELAQYPNAQSLAQTAVVPFDPTARPTATDDPADVAYDLLTAQLPLACDGEGIPGAAIYDPADSGPHPIQYLGDKYETVSDDIWRDRTDPTWLGRNVSETQLVACVEDVQTRIGECLYSISTGGFTTIGRYQVASTVRIVAAADGRVIAQNQYTGYPAACPSSTFNDSTIVGEISYDTVRPWIQTYVNP